MPQPFASSAPVQDSDTGLLLVTGNAFMWLVGGKASMVFLWILVGMVSKASNTMVAFAEMVSSVTALCLGLILKFTKPCPKFGLFLSCKNKKPFNGSVGGSNVTGSILWNSQKATLFI